MRKTKQEFANVCINKEQNITFRHSVHVPNKTKITEYQ